MVNLERDSNNRQSCHLNNPLYPFRYKPMSNKILRKSRLSLHVLRKQVAWLIWRSFTEAWKCWARRTCPTSSNFPHQPFMLAFSAILRIFWVPGHMHWGLRWGGGGEACSRIVTVGTASNFHIHTWKKTCMYNSKKRSHKGEMGLTAPLVRQPYPLATQA